MFGLSCHDNASFYPVSSKLVVGWERIDHRVVGSREISVALHVVANRNSLCVGVITYYVSTLTKFTTINIEFFDKEI